MTGLLKSLAIIATILACQTACEADATKDSHQNEEKAAVVRKHHDNEPIAKSEERVQKSPQDDLAWYQLGKQFERIENFKQAQTCYAEALRLARNLSCYKSQLAGAYERAFLRVRNLRAHAVLKAGYEASVGSPLEPPNLDKAIERYKESLAILDTPTTWWYLAVAYQQKRMATEALEAYKSATGKAEFPIEGKSVQLLDGTLVDETGAIHYLNKDSAM